jgi:hypothetical protein
LYCHEDVIEQCGDNPARALSRIPDEKQAGVDFRGVDPAGYLECAEQKKQNYVPWGYYTGIIAEQVEVLRSVRE